MTVRDPFALDGKLPSPEARYQTVVVGAGPSGIAAAIAAARTGQTVLLIDENPVAPDLMRTDVPLFYGMRMTGAVETPDRMVETLLATCPALEIALDLGVEVLLGTAAWGLYAPQPGLAALPEPMLGLADAARSWLVGFDHLVVAAGARDFALAFDGWDQPGVMGALALEMLLDRYAAFAGRRIVILGSGDLALRTALIALRHGIEVAALVEVRAAAQGDAALVAQVTASGIAILTSAEAMRAEGGADGVERVIIGEQTIACDTVCLAIAAIPAIELLAAAGAKIETASSRGGHVPVHGAGGATSLPRVTAIGDCAGIENTRDTLAYRADWIAAAGRSCAAQTNICQCEEVSRADLLGVQPPRYLGDRSPAIAARSLCTLLNDGPPDQDQVKRLTRAGMGVCQGRRCRDQVSLLLAAAAGLSPEAAPFTGYRAPVRPIPLAVLADWNEAPGVQEGWDVWFGVPAQWTPYRDIDTPREAMHIAILSGGGHI
ncbi:MAG: FAD-dependent oxidoreductase [Sandarakinorhabdus sp.]|nr:FAD-dependent oxidoreductase [Sandarakinorhabdus sp.]